MKKIFFAFLPLIALVVIVTISTIFVMNAKERSNYISKVNNLFTTYYLNEPMDLTKATIEYHEVVGKNITKSIVPITEDMIMGFNSTSIGTKSLEITYKDSIYNFTYYVKPTNTENITSNSFTLGTFYNQDTSETTEHFDIYIHAGSYLPNNYKEIIERMYQIEQEVSGLKFNNRLGLQIYQQYHPACDGNTIYIDASELFAVESSTFQHELAHALDYSQDVKFLPARTLSEGFAAYVEYLTSKKIHESYPELKIYTNSHYRILDNYRSLSTKMYNYDFESVILNLKQDEIAGNSPYEAGARFFAYLHHRYGDFCGWMKDKSFKSSTLDEWKISLKKYYKNNKIFKQFYSYEQSFANKYYVFLGADNYPFYDTHKASTTDFSNAYKVNYYFNFRNSKAYQGVKTIIYKDLYININSAKDQLTKSGINYNDLKLKTLENIQIELYNSSGILIQTVFNTKQEFSVKNVSFIKLVGSGVAQINLTY